MKKTLTIFLCLLLISCSEYKENSALENCATEIFVKEGLYYNNDVLYKKDEEYNLMKFQLLVRKNEKKQIDLILQSNKKNHQKLWADWRKENPSPEYVSTSDIEKRAKYDLESKAWKIKNDSFRNSEVIKQSNKNRVEWENKRKKINEEIYEYRGLTRNAMKEASKKKLAKMPLKKKRELENFIDTFLYCEKELKRTKKTFMLKYGS